MQEIITFADAELVTVKENETVLVALKPICEALSLDYSGQVRNIKRDETMRSVMVVTTTTGADGKTYQMLCLPLNRLNGWLFKLNTSRVKDKDVRELIVRYQRECYQTLAEHFMGRAAQQQTPQISSAAVESYQRCLMQKARRYAAYLRYEIKSRIMDFRHISAKDVAALARQAEDCRFTYSGFEQSVWDCCEPPQEFVERVAKLAEAGKLAWMDSVEWR